MLEYREIETGDAAMLLDWRTSPRVAAGYPSSVPYDIDRQARWIEKSRGDSDCYHWIGRMNGMDIGYLRFHHWDRAKRDCRLGFYIGEEKYTLCYATALDDFLYYLFRYLKIATVISYVLIDNERAIKFNEAYGYEPRPELDEDASASVGASTHVYTLNAAEWKRGKRILTDREPFPTKLWHGAPFSLYNCTAQKRV